jgi:hypothetical protein
VWIQCLSFNAGASDVLVRARAPLIYFFASACDGWYRLSFEPPSFCYADFPLRTYSKRSLYAILRATCWPPVFLCMSLSLNCSVIAPFPRGEFFAVLLEADRCIVLLSIFQRTPSIIFLR